MYEDQLINRTQDKQSPRPYLAVINNTAVAFTDDVYVTIPSIDDSDHKWGPCHWSLRGADYPHKGDQALITFDEQGVPWITEWVPTTPTPVGGGGGSVVDASDTVKGITKLSVAAAVAANPIAVGDNDPRNTNARVPTAHVHPESDVTNLTTDLAARELISHKGAASGYASLDAGTKVPVVQLPDATGAAKGVVQLAGDFGGTASAPTVPGLAAKENIANKGAANGYAPLDSGLLVPVANLPSATGAAKGAIQLAGDLAGTAVAPAVAAGAITDAKVNATAAIAESKLALATDAAVGTGSRRTLGAGALQAMPGNRTLDAVPLAAADVSINTHKLTNVVDPTVAQDAATKHYIDTLASVTAVTLPRVRLTKTGTLALPNTAVTNVTWDTANDAAGATLWSSGTPGAITIPEDGWYTITCGMWFNNASGDHDLIMAQYTNTGLRFAEANGNEAEGVYRTVTVTRRFAAGFQVGIYVFQNSGAATTVAAAAEQQAFLEVAKLPAVESAGLVVGPQAPAIGARAYNSAAVSIPTGAWTSVALNSERFDTDTIHDLVTNPSRLTARTAGKYVITAGAEFGANGTGLRALGLRLNGSQILVADIRAAVSAVSNHFSHVDTIWDLAAGDYIELIAYQDSGGALNIDANSGGNTYTPECSMLRIPGSQGMALGVTSALPANPVDGQECYYLADATNGIVWHLKYRAASTNAHKWEFIGGPPLMLIGDSTVRTLNPLGGTFQYSQTIGSIPLTGDYTVHVFALCNQTNTVGFSAVTVGFDSTGTAGQALQCGNSPLVQNTSVPVNGVPAEPYAAIAGQTPRMMFTAPGFSLNFTHQFVRLALTPVRVG